MQYLVGVELNFNYVIYCWIVFLSYSINYSNHLVCRKKKMKNSNKNTAEEVKRRLCPKNKSHSCFIAEQCIYIYFLSLCCSQKLEVMKHQEFFSPMFPPFRSNLPNSLSLFILSSLLMFCGHATLSLYYISRPLCVTTSPFPFKASHLSLIIVYCPIKEKCWKKNNNRKNGVTVREEKVKMKAFQIVLSSGFGTLYRCSLCLSQHEGGWELNYWSLVCHQVEIKAAHTCSTGTHTHPGIHLYILCCSCEDLDLMLWNGWSRVAFCPPMRFIIF